jgi:hypothetical protein
MKRFLVALLTIIALSVGEPRRIPRSGDALPPLALENNARSPGCAGSAVSTSYGVHHEEVSPRIADRNSLERSGPRGPHEFGGGNAAGPV